MRILRGDKNQCTICNKYFNSVRAFNVHRVGKFGVDRRCRTEEEMIEKGMSLNARGFWITSKKNAEVISKLHGD